ncbi:MAG: autoinducer binding domain-containing protein [Sphingobium sp.]
MKADLLGHVLAMRNAPNVLSLRRATLDFTRDFGFRSAFFLTPIARDARSGRVLANAGFSTTWERAYRRSLYMIDPIPKVALDRSVPFFWSDLTRMNEISDRGHRYLKILADHGMENGLVIPTYGPGARCGLMGLGHCDDFSAYGQMELARLQLGIQASYAHYCDLLTAELEASAPLSNREIDVLYWITQGKSNAAMAEILGISAQTVDTYVRRIFSKLGVTDRTGAAVAAIQRGFFVAGYYRRETEMEEDA